MSITPFGATGPKADWPATDLTINAAGCQLAITGDDDRAPVRTSVPQVFLHAAADAAAGAMVALTERTAQRPRPARRGVRPAVDDCRRPRATRSPPRCTAADAQRMSGGVKAGPLDVQLRWPCKDGFVSITFLFGSSIGPFTRRLMEWIYEEGFCDEATRDKDWIDYTPMLYDGREPMSEFERLKAIIGEFCAEQDQGRAAPGGQRPDAADRSGGHARGRGQQQAVRRPRLLRPGRRPAAARDQPVIAPGPYAWSSTVAPLRLGRAPRLGEHTESVRAERRGPHRRTGGADAPGRAAPAARRDQGARHDLGDVRPGDDAG